MHGWTSTMRKPVTAAVLAALALTWAPLASAQKIDVKFRLDYFPKGIHALFHTAKAKGFYDEQSLNVTIVPGDGSGNTIKLVGAGDYDFGFADGPTGIVGRSRGIPVVAIGAVHQRSPLGMASLKESGLARPKDIEGKTVGIQPQAATYVFWMAFAEMNKIDRAKVKEINMAGELPVFVLEKRVHAVAALYDNEFITIEAKAPGNASFMLGEDFGYRAYGQSLFTNEKTLKERPELMRRFLAATKKGMQYAIANQKEAIDILMKQFRDLDRGIVERQLAYGAQRLYTSPDTDKHGLLWMEKERWDLAHQVMVEQKVAAGPIDVATFFTTEFLR